MVNLRRFACPGVAMKKRALHRSRGVSLVEFAAAIVFGFPLVMAMLYAVLEANYYFTIQTNLDAAARRAAQALINQFAKPGGSTANISNGNLPALAQFDIPAGDGVHYIVNHNANQFTVVWDFTTQPPTVTVAVKYPAGGDAANGLLPFPWPDPLKLGPSFNISTMVTFAVP